MASIREYLTQIHTIAAYEIAGGIFGLLIVGERVLAGHGGLVLILYPAFMLYAGLLLWRNQPKGFKFSARVQLIQIPIISVPYFVYVIGLPILSYMMVAWGGEGEEWEVGLPFGFTSATLQFIMLDENPDVAGRMLGFPISRMLGFQPIALLMYLKLRSEMKRRAGGVVVEAVSPGTEPDILPQVETEGKDKRDWENPPK